jgi:hypothetical protein
MNHHKPRPWMAAHEEIEIGPGWAWLGRPLSLLELAGAGTLTWLVLARLLAGDCMPGSGCAVVYLLFVLPGSILAAVALLVAHNLFVRDMRRRIKLDVVLTLGVLVWLLAGQRAMEHQARLEQQQFQVVQTLDRASADSDDRYARDRFLAARRDSATHGPPGQVPGVLAVQDDGIALRVELLDSLRPELPLALARVRPDPARPGGWSGCPMRAQGAQTKYGAYLLRPGAALSFTLAPRCAEAFRDAPLEFRVGSWKAGGDSPGWWSDSALAVPEGWVTVDAAGDAPRMGRHSAPATSDAPLAIVPAPPRTQDGQ